MNLYKIAWRNLWRNRKRTLITIASVFFGVLWAVLLKSLQTGSFDNMVDNMVKFTSGYIQIQNTDYKQTKSLNNSFVPDTSLLSLLEQNEDIHIYTPRLKSFALAASEEQSFGTAVFGVRPEIEEQISNFSQWIVEGAYLAASDNGIIIGDILAKNLDVVPGDTLALIGQGYHGVQAAGLFPIRGLLRFPIPDLNKQILYMGIETAQDFFQAPGLVTSLVLMVDGPSMVEPVVDQLKNYNNPEIITYSWEELQPQLVQLIAGKTSSGKIFIGILFILVGFGILGTFIMMVAERKRELGIMIAIGMQRVRLSAILFLESLLIGALGVFCSYVFCLPLIGYFVKNPIRVGGEMAKVWGDMGFEPVIMFSGAMEVFSGPAITVFIISIIISVYPITSVIGMKAVDALRA
ncbi:MAG: FtsX-like permease family protein [Bacteroidota bacterium]|nr:FtsX-like permease family protein [Bacteroidota bacterium]